MEREPAIRKLAELLARYPTVTIAPGVRMYRGCWVRDPENWDGHWFATTVDSAKEYGRCHRTAANYDERSAPCLVEGVTNCPLHLLEMHDSHIEVFQHAYDCLPGSPLWDHRAIDVDLPRALSLFGRRVDGITRPLSEEYFVCAPKCVLTAQITSHPTVFGVDVQKATVS